MQKKLGWYRSGGFKFDPFLKKEDKNYFKRQLKVSEKRGDIIDKEGAKMARIADKIARREALKDEKFLKKEFKKADKF